MKLLAPGHWLGRGSMLLEGRSLGETIEGEADIEHDEGGVSIRLQFVVNDKPGQMIVRIAGNDVGTYVVSLRSDLADTLMGTAKLDSEPNLGGGNRACNVHTVQSFGRPGLPRVPAQRRRNLHLGSCFRSKTAGRQG